MIGFLIVVASVLECGGLTPIQDPPPRLHLNVGDTWSADRTVRYVSTEAQINMQDDDHFEYSVEKVDRQYFVSVKRHQTGTHLPSGVFVPAPDGDPEEWKQPLSDKGEVSLPNLPVGRLEQILARLVVAAWNGPARGSASSLVSVRAVNATSEEIVYDEAPIHGHAHISGTATLNPSTHVPMQISLLGDGVTIPGGTDFVSIRVEYKVQPKGSKGKS